MLYRKIIAVCSQIHTKHIKTVCGQNVELLNVKLVVHIVTTGHSKSTRSVTESTRKQDTNTNRLNVKQRASKRIPIQDLT